MKLAIILGVLGVYIIVAFVIARFCAVNAGWEKIADLLPPNGEDGFAEPEPKNLGGSGDAGQ
ncbi:MAG: hypothetical protein ABIK65_10800 [Candidatus Eisenbacteria bacterium]